MEEEILRKMDERTKYKNLKDMEGRLAYQTLKNEIKRECKKAMEEWMKENSDETKEFMNKGQVDFVYRKVKMEFRKRKKKRNNITNKEGEPV